MLQTQVCAVEKDGRELWLRCWWNHQVAGHSSRRFTCCACVQQAFDARKCIGTGETRAKPICKGFGLAWLLLPLLLLLLLLQYHNSWCLLQQPFQQPAWLRLGRQCGAGASPRWAVPLLWHIVDRRSSAVTTASLDGGPESVFPVCRSDVTSLIQPASTWLLA
jgi:hypothetical protein